MRLRARLKEFRQGLVKKAHGSGSRILAGLRGEMQEQPLLPETIIEGSPRARGYCAMTSPDGTLFSGEWECTAGSFSWSYHDDELIRVLEGEAFIEIDGEFKRFGPGDTVFFPMGGSARWRVPKYVRKVFFIRHPGRAVELLRDFKMPGQSAP